MQFTTFKVGSIFHFSDGNIGCLTSHGRLAMVHPSGMTLAAHYHPKLADYVQRHMVDTMVEPEEDYGTVTIQWNIRQQIAA